MKFHTDFPGLKPEIERLQYLTQDHVKGKTHAELAEAACQAGIKWIQFRTKNTPESEWEAMALAVQRVAKKHNAVLIINDNVGLAYSINADGVHLGKEDMSIKDARKILGHTCIIGGTANTADDIMRLAYEGADYIGLGPYRFTATKQNLSPVLDIEDIIDLVKLQNKVPVVLIGGITSDDIEAIAASGAYGLAVSSAINLAKDVSISASIFNSETLKYFNA